MRRYVIIVILLHSFEHIIRWNCCMNEYKVIQFCVRSPPHLLGGKLYSMAAIRVQTYVNLMSVSINNPRRSLLLPAFHRSITVHQYDRAGFLSDAKHVLSYFIVIPRVREVRTSQGRHVCSVVPHNTPS